MCSGLAVGISAVAVGNSGAKTAAAPTSSIGPVSSSRAGGLDAV